MGRVVRFGELWQETGSKLGLDDLGQETLIFPVSSCKRSIETILTQPVAMWRAEFWTVWSFWIRYGEVLGYQMGTAYMKRNRIRNV